MTAKTKSTNQNPKARSAPSPQLGGQAIASTYLTQCKVCLLGIYGHQQRMWSRQPLGLCHTECVGGVA